MINKLVQGEGSVNESEIISEVRGVFAEMGLSADGLRAQRVSPVLLRIDQPGDNTGNWFACFQSSTQSSGAYWLLRSSRGNRYVADTLRRAIDKLARREFKSRADMGIML